MVISCIVIRNNVFSVSCVVIGNKFRWQVAIVGTCFWVVVLKQREKRSIHDQLLLGPVLLHSIQLLEVLPY